MLTISTILSWCKIFSISGLKPISNILSASSRTKNLTDLKDTTPLPTKSFNRPGVATNTCTPFYKKNI